MEQSSVIKLLSNVFPSVPYYQIRCAYGISKHQQHKTHSITIKVRTFSKIYALIAILNLKVVPQNEQKCEGSIFFNVATGT